jgi:iron(III) transport system permease protein
MVLVPLGVLSSAWFGFDPATWRHLSDHLLPDLFLNTLILVAGVGGGVLLLGVSLAWLTVMCEFPGRRFFDWALMLPFAMPAYVLAFVFLGLMDFTGPVQGFLRDLLGLSGSWFVDVRHAGGVILVMTLVLYPYVYMLARVAFLGQGQSAFEAARVLGLDSRAAFFRVALPMARPAIMAGLSLALMETLADFGAVSVFNFDTFTTAIYKAWFGLFDLQAAAQLASLLLFFVALALFSERYFRGRSRYHTADAPQRLHRFRLRGWRAWGAFSYLGLVFFLAFALPLGQLLLWAWASRGDLDGRYPALVAHTLLLGAMAAVLTLLGAFILSYGRRHYDGILTRFSVQAGTLGYALPLSYARRHYDGILTRFSVQAGTLGYALPGSVLAVGIMLSLVWVDHRIADLADLLFGIEPGLLLSGSLISLLLAYFTRFLAVAFGPVDSALERIRPVLREAARSLGASSAEIIRRIYVPMLRPGLLAAALLVLVDVMKEMPATLLLRPFGWDTLAVRIYEMTSEGEWERAALPAVTLVAAGLLPVLLLMRRSAAAH